MPDNRTIFTGKEFSGLRYGAETVSGFFFEDCTFDDCTFDATTFENCTFRNCLFIRCAFVMPAARNTDMRFCDFKKCVLLGVSFMSFVNDEHIRKPVNSIEDSRLTNCLFHDMSFPGHDFSSNKFSKCEFSECRLRGAVFRGCILGGTSFSNSDLREADFRGSEGYAIDIFNDKLRGARFSLPEAMDLLAALDIKIE
jgi:uncharacterized protein YjbI with pentapeptide repeats